jgi:integrase
MPLTSLAVKTAKPKPTAYKLADERGLFLFVTPAGGKLWRLKYRFEGREKSLSIGAFPEVSLTDARDKRDDARRLLAKGIDPSADKKSKKHHVKSIAGDSFEVIAREWLGKQTARWSPTYADSIRVRLENDVFPHMGARPISGITPAEVLGVLRKIEARGAGEQARRAQQHISAVLRYAVVTGRAPRDVAADVKGALAPTAVEHHPAVTEPEDIGKLLNAIEGYTGSFWVKHALLLLAHTFVRPSELREAKWGELDLDGRTWSVPAARMKMRHPHTVPLTDATAALFEALKAVRGRSDYVFPGHRSPDVPVSASALLRALLALRYGAGRHVAHGFRSTASTRLHEAGFPIDHIEAQLAHTLRGVRGVYNRAMHLEQRREMMVWWSQYLNDLQAKARA